jgi:hypothetical protein
MVVCCSARVAIILSGLTSSQTSEVPCLDTMRSAIILRLRFVVTLAFQNPANSKIYCCVHPRVTEFGVAQLCASIILVAIHERKTRGNAGHSRLPESPLPKCSSLESKSNLFSRYKDCRISREAYMFHGFLRLA